MSFYLTPLNDLCSDRNPSKTQCGCDVTESPQSTTDYRDAINISSDAEANTGKLISIIRTFR